MICKRKNRNMKPTDAFVLVLVLTLLKYSTAILARKRNSDVETKVM